MKMVDEDAGRGLHAATGEHEALGGGGASPQAPGWYPSRTNPSDQTYWDGQNWTGRRRWTTGKGWSVAGDVPDEAMHDTSPPLPNKRLSANPYIGSAPSRSRATGFTFSLGVFLLLVCGIGLMYGSVGEWVHVGGSVGITDFHVSVNGIDPAISTLIGINGWVTFIGGILIVVFACFAMTSEEVQLAIFTTIIAAATAIFATYDMFRIVQKINQVPTSGLGSVSVGWGLICVLSAAALALLISVVKLIQH
jgi:hypothetical protein